VGDPFARASILNSLGIVLNSDSRFPAATEAFEQGLVLLAGIQPSTDAAATLRATLIGNLGGSKILTNDFDEGIYLINTALPDLKTQYLKAEACSDLCLAYMQTERFQEAEYYGYEALELACVARQTRNANHLLGEIMVRTNRQEQAEDFFDVVADFYPQFGNVRQLLMSVDLCSVVNWKGY
jgi:Flp pilus assembly protein TadD